MLDREKVIKGLEQFKADFKPFCGNKSDWARVDDALALLKEQEPQETRLVRHYSRPGVYADLWLHCEKCGGKIGDGPYRPRYCPECGRKVNWGD